MYTRSSALHTRLCVCVLLPRRIPLYMSLAAVTRPTSTMSTGRTEVSSPSRVCSLPAQQSDTRACFSCSPRITYHGTGDYSSQAFKVHWLLPGCCCQCRLYSGEMSSSIGSKRQTSGHSSVGRRYADCMRTLHVKP
jgi:hypothetical protein